MRDVNPLTAFWVFILWRVKLVLHICAYTYVSTLQPLYSMCQVYIDGHNLSALPTVLSPMIQTTPAGLEYF